jgi:exosortase/archaeosortase family protein
MHGTAGATADILCLIGIPSVQSGNLVHIETGVIDIDEACSGIRSLQAMIMLSLFLGELFRLKLSGRILLMALGLAFTLLANVLRTVILGSIGFGQGMSAVDRYHDATGLSVLIFSLSCTLLAAFMMRPAPPPAPAQNQPGNGSPLPLKLCAALLVWFFIEETSVEAWYRAHEPKWQGWSWAVQWPRDSKDFRFIQIPKRSLQDLMCDESSAAAWKEADGSEWSLYWLRWNRGNAAAEGAKVHRPDLCLTAAGAILEKDMGMRLISAGDTQLPFHSYTFRMGEKTLYVFFGLYEEMPGGEAFVSNPHFHPAGILDRAIKGQRGLGQQTLEAAVSGYASELAAREGLSARLGRWMRARPGLAKPSAYGGGAAAPISTARR